MPAHSRFVYSVILWAYIEGALRTFNQMWILDSARYVISASNIPERNSTNPSGDPKTPMSPSPSAPSVQSETFTPPADPDLAQIVAAWPGLPQDIKQAIRILITPFMEDKSNDA